MSYLQALTEAQERKSDLYRHHSRLYNEAQIRAIVMRAQSDPDKLALVRLYFLDKTQEVEHKRKGGNR
jgi:hypothetical protein